MKQLLISIALTASALLAGGQALAADCGKVVIGEMNWACALPVGSIMIYLPQAQ
ncbi:hypothetical protein N8Y93_03400 [Litorivicinus sp.]|nr:hypothetical protein [Litorivicinus sp.]